MPVTHRTQSAVADAGVSGEIGPSEWNETHKSDIVLTFGGYTLVTNIGAAADAVALSKGFGLALVDMTGIDTIEMRVYYNKVTASTYSWQLWNVTDGAQIGVIADTGAINADKIASGQFTGVNLTGLKLLRLRGWSSAAADDPVFYGATALLRDT